MNDVVCEPLGALGELRAYRRPGPPDHLAFEILREADGRAWTLRLPWEQRAIVRHLTADTLPRLHEPESFAFNDQGCAEIARAVLSAQDEVATIVLEQAGEHAFAVWRRELSRKGWSWTLDVVVVPLALADLLCKRMVTGLDRLEQPRR